MSPYLQRKQKEVFIKELTNQLVWDSCCEGVFKGLASFRGGQEELF